SASSRTPPTAAMLALQSRSPTSASSTTSSAPAKTTVSSQTRESVSATSSRCRWWRSSMLAQANSRQARARNQAAPGDDLRAQSASALRALLLHPDIRDRQRQRGASDRQLKLGEKSYLFADSK